MSHISALTFALAVASSTAATTISRPVAVGPTSLDVPAWIQAVGSVFAILLAIFVPWNQQRLADRKEKLNRRHLSSFILGHVNNYVSSEIKYYKNLHGQLERYYLKDDSVDWLAAAKKSLNTIKEQVSEIERLKSLPIGDWPNFQAASKYYLLCSVNRQHLDVLTHNFSIIEKQSSAKRFHYNISTMEESLNKICAELAKALGNVATFG